MRTQRGFTLIEVVVAMTIVAIALISLVESTGSSVKSTGYLRDKVLANWVAQNVLNEALLKESFPAKGNKSGKESMAGRDWRWKRTVKETPDKDFRALEVEVFQGDSEYALAKLVTYVGNGMVTCERPNPSQVECYQSQTASNGGGS